jgi:hypothetical protein
MAKKQSEEELWKVRNYFPLLSEHIKCESGPYYGAELWKHIKKCEVSIPEPRIFPDKA